MTKFAISASAILLLLINSVIGAILENPPLKTMNLGTESKKFRWGAGRPFVEGSYENGTYTLTGNGHGVYWCQDGAAFAYVNEPPLKGEFVFTVRIASAQIPTEGVTQIGIAVKGRLGINAPVLSLRWDTHWSKSKGSGLTWFNRYALRKEHLVLDAAPAEKSCHGRGQGCLGKGLENHLDGYTSLEGLWLRVERKIVNNTDQYHLYARSDGQSEWTHIESVAGENNACAGDPLDFVPNMSLPHFIIPENQHGQVYPGIFVSSSTFGGSNVTAEFDNISLEAENIEEKVVQLSNDFPENATWWPNFMGPNNNFTSGSDQCNLVDYIADAKMVWKSDSIFPPGRSQAGRYGCNEGNYPTGGGSSPIVADGKVFQYYQVPEPGYSPTEPYRPKCTNWTEEEWSLLFSPVARDVVHCLDAKTGKTLWRRSDLGTGTYQSYAKGILPNHTPVYSNGRVFAAGGGGKFYCFNAETGETIWTGSAGLPGTSALMLADGVLVTGIGGKRGGGNPENLVGIDTANGNRIWTVNASIGGGATPSVWPHDGKEYVVVADNAGTFRMIDPKDGEEMWKIDTVGDNWKTLHVGDDHVFVNLGSRDKGDRFWGCYKLTVSGPELQWIMPKSQGMWRKGVIYEGYFYAEYDPDPGDPGAMVVYSMETGEIASKSSLGGGQGNVFQVEDRIINEQIAEHAPAQFFMYHMEPDNVTIAEEAFWSPRNPTTTTYSEADVNLSYPFVNGRLFVRGRDGIYCYDLRKNQCGVPLSATPGSGFHSNKQSMIWRKLPNGRIRIQSLPPFSDVFQYDLQGKMNRLQSNEDGVIQLQSNTKGIKILQIPDPKGKKQNGIIVVQ